MEVEWFVSRRVAMIWSDNGTNINEADKELAESIEKWKIFSFVSEVAIKGIKWIFNTPSTTRHGGIQERLVGSFKRVL